MPGMNRVWREFNAQDNQDDRNAARRAEAGEHRVRRVDLAHPSDGGRAQRGRRHHGRAAGLRPLGARPRGILAYRDRRQSHPRPYQRSGQPRQQHLRVRHLAARHNHHARLLRHRLSGTQRRHSEFFGVALPLLQHVEEDALPFPDTLPLCDALPEGPAPDDAALRPDRTGPSPVDEERGAFSAPRPPEGSYLLLHVPALEQGRRRASAAPLLQLAGEPSH